MKVYRLTREAREAATSAKDRSRFVFPSQEATVHCKREECELRSRIREDPRPYINKSRASHSSLSSRRRSLLDLLLTRLLPIARLLLRVRRRLFNDQYLVVASPDGERHLLPLSRLGGGRVRRSQHRLPHLDPRPEVVASVALEDGKDDLVEGVRELGVLGERATEELGDGGRRIVEGLASGKGQRGRCRRVEEGLHHIQTLRGPAHVGCAAW